MSRTLVTLLQAVARRTGARPLLTLGGLAAALTASDPALAYCRATTCGSDPNDYCAVGDNGCVIDGLPLSWPQGSTLDFMLDEDSAEEANVYGAAPSLENAVDAWSEVRCGNDPPKIRLSVVQDYEAPDGAGTIDVVFVSSGWPYEDDAVGRTVIEFYSDSGWMSGATILLNAQHYVLSRNPDETEVDLTAVLTHEIGHVLALGHSSVAGATMQSETTTQFDVEVRTLSHDDATGLCALYPPNSQTIVFDVGEGGSGGEGGSSGDGSEEPGGASCSYVHPAQGARGWLTLGTLLAGAVGLRAARRRARRFARS